MNPYELEVVSIRLVRDAPLLSDIPITTPEHAVRLLGDYLCDFDREMMCVIYLKADNTPISCSFVSMGALDKTIAHPREIFKAAILSNAATMILIHNHPSGRLTPSPADTELTDRMIYLGEMIGIPVIDHIIVGGDNTRYFSFNEHAMIEMPNLNLETDAAKIDFNRSQEKLRRHR